MPGHERYVDPASSRSGLFGSSRAAPAFSYRRDAFHYGTPSCPVLPNEEEDNNTLANHDDLKHHNNSDTAQDDDTECLIPANVLLYDGNTNDSSRDVNACQAHTSARTNQEGSWKQHPSHVVVLSMLEHRGIVLPRHHQMVEYHMASLFLHYLDICRLGTYLVHYKTDRWPRERFFRLRLLPRHLNSSAGGPSFSSAGLPQECIPQLVRTVHAESVDIEDMLPLEDLVAVTCGTDKSPAFAPYLLSASMIVGSRQGRGHRAKLPTRGAFTLWFRGSCLRNERVARSISLLTCHEKVFDVWIKAMRGLLSVNSTNIT